MKELQEILKTFAQTKKDAQPATLATIVKTTGSAYRRPGARLLFTSTGTHVGTLSGGCLERDVCYHMEHSLASGQPLLVTYDTSTDEDLYLGLGLGCNGVIQVLIEQLSGESISLNFLADCWHRRVKGVLATVFAVENVADVQVGDRLTLDRTQVLNSDLANFPLQKAIAEDARLVFEKQQSAVYQYQLAQGTVEVFLEFVQPPPSLTIFGAQNDAIPLAAMAGGLGWRVMVVDTRLSPSSTERFPMVEEVILTLPENAHKSVKVDHNSICVLMTHNYLQDLALLKWLLPLSPFYLGILGSRHRSERLLKDLASQGSPITTQQPEGLYAPIGLDIGAETPEAIALSILAEIQAVLTKRSGKSLRESNSSIHPPLTRHHTVMP